MTERNDAITPPQYHAFQHAYDFMNGELFSNSLPHVLITLQRHAKAAGYFSPDRFSGRIDKQAVAHELAMNPDTFGRTDEVILSTLVHEMVHLWQQTFGKPPRRCYHNREWADKMVEVGLQPSSTGHPGGAETGQRMSHYIIPGGAYEQAFSRLRESSFELRWQSAMAVKAKGKNSKTKFTCPDCGLNAWAKPGATLVCGDCYNEDGEFQTVMTPAS